MNHSLSENMQSLLQGEDLNSLFPTKGTRNEHQPSPSAYEQFQSEYPQLSSGRSWMNAGVNTILGGSTPSPEMMRGEVDLRDGEPGLEDAFIGMDTLTGYAVPRLASAYGKQVLKNAPEIATGLKSSMDNIGTGVTPAYDDLMNQLEPENLPAMLRKQAGFDDDPNFISKPTTADDFSMEMIEQMEIARGRKK